MECPCKNCIVLGRCKALMLDNPIMFIMNISRRCSLYDSYVVTKRQSQNVVINFEHANEAGKYLGYTIDGKVVKKTGKS